VTGIDVKIKNKCRNEKLVFAGIELEPLKRPDPEKKDYLVGFRATAVFFDREGFLTALKSAPNNIETLKKLFSYRFTDEGWASPSTCEAIAYNYVGTGVYYRDKYGNQREKKEKTGILIEKSIMMASRRATNRAKREATGTGLTSVEELPLINENTEKAISHKSKSPNPNPNPKPITSAQITCIKSMIEKYNWKLTDEDIKKMTKDEASKLIQETIEKERYMTAIQRLHIIWKDIAQKYEWDKHTLDLKYKDFLFMNFSKESSKELSLGQLDNAIQLSNKMLQE
jgi:hypothetical protein